MIKITKTYKTYTFEELSQKAKNRVINNYINEYIEWTDWVHLSPMAKKACKKAEDMQTPWFAGGYYWDYAKKEIINKLKKYTYLENGELFNN